MGSVAMGIGGSYRFEGNTITQIAYCLYCDKCGSFSIGRRITTKMLVWIYIAAIIATVFWYSARDGALPGAWFVCFGSILFFISMTGVLALGYRCKKCGSAHISMPNSAEYPENDRSVLGIPYEATAKLYMDDY
jgi:ribosomal protein L44E